MAADAAESPNPSLVLPADATVFPSPRTTFLRVAGAFVRRDLAIQASYRFAFALRTGSALVVLASFSFLARFLSSGGVGLPVSRYGGAGFVGFWLVGLCTAEVFHTITMVLARRIRETQLEGTLEAVLATPATTWQVMLSIPLAETVIALPRILVLLLSGPLLFGVSFGPVNVLTLLVAVVLALLAFVSLGILGGAMTMCLRRVDPITALVAMSAAVVGGVLYPIDVLPPALRACAYALPLAPALEMVRQALFADASLQMVSRELVALGSFIVVVTPAGALLFGIALRRARADGSLAHY
ncbi:MAG: ABC transporter permease [Pseudomonadota bacterium]